MSEQQFADNMVSGFGPGSGAESCDHPARSGLARFLPDSTTLVTLASVISFAILVTGCVGTVGIVPKAEPLTAAAVGIDPRSAPVALDAQWWRSFGEPQLDALVERALAAGPSLELARARIERAAAQTDAARGAGGPRLDAAFDATRQRFTEHGLVPPAVAGSTRISATLQASGSWEIDFFGRNRAALDASLGAERAGQADAEASRLLLAGNVARGYVQLARLLAQRDVAARSLAQRGEVLGLIRQRVGAGLDTHVELRQGEGSVPEAAQQVEALDEQIALARHALAALTAQPPEALDALAPRLAAVRALPLPARVPADLLGRRPDVEAARRRVEAAIGDVAAAKAATYPNVSLTAFAGLSAIGLDRLIDLGSRQYGVGPAIRLPIFDAGRLRAAVRGRTADLDAAVAGYNQTLVDAVRDAADQIASVQSVERQRRTQAQASASAESAYDLARQRFRAGLGTYLTVLNAESAVLAQRRQAADLDARRLDTQVALARSLGGGYGAPSGSEGSSPGRRADDAGAAGGTLAAR